MREQSRRDSKSVGYGEDGQLRVDGRVASEGENQYYESLFGDDAVGGNKPVSLDEFWSRTIYEYVVMRGVSMDDFCGLTIDAIAVLNNEKTRRADCVNGFTDRAKRSAEQKKGDCLVRYVIQVE